MGTKTFQASLAVICDDEHGSLTDTIESLISQTLRPHEIILVGISPSKRTSGIMRDYTSRFPGWISSLTLPGTVDFTGACRLIFDIARGSHVGVISDHLALSPHKLEVDYAALKRNPAARAVYSVDADVDGRSNVGTPSKHNDILRLTALTDGNILNTLIVERDIVKRIPNLDLKHPGTYGHWLTMSLAHSQPIACIESMAADPHNHAAGHEFYRGSPQLLYELCLVHCNIQSYLRRLSPRDRGSVNSHWLSRMLDVLAQMPDSMIADGHRATQAIMGIPNITAECLILLAEFNVRTGNPFDARRFCQMGINLDRDNPDILYQCGRIALAFAEYAAAISAFERAVAHRPDFVEAYHQMANAYLARRDPEPALACFERVLELDPDHHDSREKRSRIINNYCQAKEFFQISLAKAPHDPVLHCGLGNLLLRNGNHIGAEIKFRDAISLDSSYAESFFGLGKALLELGQTQEAREEFLKTLEIRPDHPSARYYLEGTGDDTVSHRDKIRYVEQMFDNFSADFDEQLTTHLAYRIPQQLYDMLNEIPEYRGKLFDILDVGCGTGLSGAAFRHKAKTLTGVDVSSNMITQAQCRGIYDHLHHDDYLQFLRNNSTHYDLIISADVFIYVGNLSDTMSLFSRHLKTNGIILFSVENSSLEGYNLQCSGRYAHSEAYIRALCSKHEMEVVSVRPCMVRMENHKPIDGSMYLLRKF